MAMYGYVRCSTDRQMVLQQCDALRGAGCDRIFRDKAISATARYRAALLSIKAILQPGDIFAVAAIDRAFRSTAEAIDFLDDVMKRGVTFRSLAQHIDTRTPEGRKWYIDAANNAEYERAVIARRTRDAMQALKRRGRKFGRPRKLTRKKIARARLAVRNRRGRTMDQIARSLRISRSSLYRAVREA
jgi:DNA invertase Pin-like site-specific DNA recombinase